MLFLACVTAAQPPSPPPQQHRSWPRPIPSPAYSQSPFLRVANLSCSPPAALPLQLPSVKPLFRPVGTLKDRGHLNNNSPRSISFLKLLCSPGILAPLRLFSRSELITTPGSCNRVQMQFWLLKKKFTPLWPHQAGIVDISLSVGDLTQRSDTLPTFKTTPVFQVLAQLFPAKPSTTPPTQQFCTSYSEFLIYS